MKCISCGSITVFIGVHKGVFHSVVNIIFLRLRLRVMIEGVVELVLLNNVYKENGDRGHGGHHGHNGGPFGGQRWGSAFATSFSSNFSVLGVYFFSGLGVRTAVRSKGDYILLLCFLAATL